MTEMMEESLDTIDDDEIEEEADAEVDKVLFELTDGKLGQAGKVGGQLPVSRGPSPVRPPRFFCSSADFPPPPPWSVFHMVPALPGLPFARHPMLYVLTPCPGSQGRRRRRGGCGDAKDAAGDAGSPEQLDGAFGILFNRFSLYTLLSFIIHVH